MKISLLPHQKEILNSTRGKTRVGYFMEMGTGKTFVSSEKAKLLDADILIICPKSILSMWKNHYETYYPRFKRFDLTKPKEYALFFKARGRKVGFINYDLVFRRAELANLRDYTLLLDESSLIKNENTKRTKFIINKLKPTNVILCSGTVCGGKYEYLWSQLKLLGWSISKRAFWNKFVRYEVDMSQGFPITYVYGYKRVDDLKQEIHNYGGRFLKTEDVLTLPDQIFTEIQCEMTPEYKKMQKNGIVKLKDGTQLVGDTILTKLLYMRMLCGHYNPKKIEALKDIIHSTNDRLIIFYNFTAELEIISEIARAENRPLSIINGSVKDLKAYENHEDSITVIQIQAGSMGLNLQKANKIIYFTPPLSSEQYEQSKKRTHRLGQNRTCFYYNLVCEGSVEEKIYANLAMRRDYSNALFEGDYG